MSWWDFFKSAPPPLQLEGSGDYDFEIVGEASYQDALEAICGGRTDWSQEKPVIATLIHEDRNPYDDQAIRVDVEGRTVGYLTRAGARQYRKWLAAQGYAGRTATCSALIVGGWDRDDRGRGHFGIKLDLPSLY